MEALEPIITDYSEFHSHFRYDGFIYHGTVFIDGRYHLFWNRTSIVDEAEPWTTYYWNGVKTAERDVSGRTFYAVYPISDELHDLARKGKFPHIGSHNFPLTWKDGTKPIGYIVGEYSDTEFHDENRRWQNWDGPVEKDIPPELQELFDNMQEEE